MILVQDPGMEFRLPHSQANLPWWVQLEMYTLSNRDPNFLSSCQWATLGSCVF